VVNYVASILTLVLDEFGAVLADDSGAAILRLLDGPVRSYHEALWCPAAGSCLASLKTHDEAEAAASVAQIGLNLSAIGAVGEWELTVPEARRFHWGPVLLPAGRHLRVEASDSEALVTIDTGDGLGTARFRRGEPYVSQGRGCAILPHIGDGPIPLLLLGEAEVAALGVPRPDLPFLPAISRADEHPVVEALQLLRRHLSRCHLWVDRAARHLGLIQSPSAHINSGSFERYFGYLYFTGTADPIQMAEMFIHECAHQYFHLVSCLGNVTEEDERWFYSPFPRAQRHADRILLAYHAFANVELFYKECVRVGLDPQRAAREIERLRTDVDTVEKILVGEARLTPLGMDLLMPLVAARAIS
jgi:HEXXH motif-containing protein